MKYTVVGEVFGLLFVISLTYLFLNSREMKLVDMVRIIGVLYIPQRVALFLQCKYMMAGIFKKVEDERSG